MPAGAPPPRPRPRPGLAAATLTALVLACALTPATSSNHTASLPVRTFNLTDATLLVNGSSPYVAELRADSLEYRRCKDTHRCNRAERQYNLRQGTFEFNAVRFNGGTRDGASLFMDFEDWRAGTMALGMDFAYLNKTPEITRGSHFNSFDENLDVPLPTSEFDGHLVVNNPDVLLTFNTTPSPPTLTIEDTGPGCHSAVRCVTVLDGFVYLSDFGTEAAIFNFLSVYVGDGVHVSLHGDRSLVVMSRSTALWDTPLHVAPGTLGAFPRAAAPSQFNNNYFGPGSGAQRVYMQTLTTFAADVDEVQTVRTFADTGQTLRGGFQLSYRGDVTHVIAHDAEPGEVKRAIESSLYWAGTVTVTRSARTFEGGYTWTVVFNTAVGDIEQLQVADRLTGIGHGAVTDTAVHGNTIGGSYRLAVRWNATHGDPVVTAPIPVTATEEEVEDICMEAWGWQNGFGPDGSAQSVHVTRTDPTMLCDHGLCENGPQGAWGYTYFVTYTTNQTVTSPTSPTRPASPSFDEQSPHLPVYVFDVNVTSSVPGAFANVSIEDNIEQGLAPRLALHNFTTPVTVSYGGNGGANGGAGGEGHSRHLPPGAVNNNPVYDIVGGSSGAAGGQTAQDAMSADLGVGYGGSGGGALELVAVNDLIIGPNGGVSVPGEAGGDGAHGGGGGSGGTVVLSAGGVMVLHANVTAAGGPGGDATYVTGRGGGGGSGGRVAGYAQSLNMALGVAVTAPGAPGGSDAPTRDPPVYVRGQRMAFFPYKSYHNGRARTPSTTRGDDGSVYLLSAGGARYQVEVDGGAADTQRALKVTVQETVVSDSGVLTRAPFAGNGPDYVLPSDTSTWVMRRGDNIRTVEGQTGGAGSDGVNNVGAAIDRLTVYVMVAPPGDGRDGRDGGGDLDTHWGAHIALHDTDFRTVVEGQLGNPPEGNGPGGNLGAGPGGPGAGTGQSLPRDAGAGGGINNDSVALIGVALVDGKFKHQANYRHTPGMDLSPQSPQTVGFRNVQPMQWYKVDVYIDWERNVYKVRIDDVTVALDVPFRGERVKRLGLYVFDAGTAWFDEVYMGPEFTNAFECPVTVADAAALAMTRPGQSGWKQEDVGPDTTAHDVTQAANHVSTRKAFQRTATSGFVARDGSPHREFHQDVHTRPLGGDHSFTRGSVNMATLEYVGPDEYGANPHGRYYWYGDHEVDTDADLYSKYAVDTPLPSLPQPPADQGGVYACSTVDMVTWRNEGIMLYNFNLSDTTGRQAEVANLAIADQFYLRNERPKVMWNNATQKFVMWMYVDNHVGRLRLAGLATSDWPDGPFTFEKTLLPDRNETTDLTVFKLASGAALLARTYYANKTYLLPTPIQQPIWESVKLPEHSVDDVKVDYAMNYHRAFYHQGYDNIDDIFVQRWRHEQLAWRVVIGEVEETYDLKTDQFMLTNTTAGSLIVRYSPANRATALETHVNQNVFREILGQGQPPILTRYKDPTQHSLWEPGSVPAVRTQTWEQNYLDKNIADNPLHPTVADLLIGLPRVVEVRRAKYVAVSLLTDDYLDTVGVLQTLEGEMEGEDDLIVLLSAFGGFGWQDGFKPGDELSADFVSTYPFDTDGIAKPRFAFDTEYDWETRHWQFLSHRGDRRNDFVNFRDKQVDLNCPALHNATQAKYRECEFVLAQRTPIVPEEAQINWQGRLDVHSEARPTDLYEQCQRELHTALLDYQNCVRDQLVDFDALAPWGVGSRECVGGGGECGPPETGQRPSADD